MIYDREFNQTTWNLQRDFYIEKDVESPWFPQEHDPEMVENQPQKYLS